MNLYGISLIREIYKMCANGWEPFAVVCRPSGEMSHHFKRVIEK